ncbi:MAG: hypothetical protein KDI39_13230 [Pseudomonadales bacterium]|nr:hypothetical protein [Pseudomonadales bacterium]
MRQQKTNTLLRQWYILRQLRYVHYVSTQDIKDSLQQHYDINVDLRTIQRDLQGLASIFPLECRDESVPYGWRWQKEATHELPISHTQALTFMMVEAQLKDVLPHTVLKELQPYFDASKAIVEGNAICTPMLSVSCAAVAGIGKHPTFFEWLTAMSLSQKLKALLTPEQEKQEFSILFHTLNQHGLGDWSNELKPLAKPKKQE